jgi:hypothetical protein
MRQRGPPAKVVTAAGGVARFSCGAGRGRGFAGMHEPMATAATVHFICWCSATSRRPMMKTARFLQSLGLAAVLFSFDPASSRFAAAAPDNTLGMAILGGLITSDGTISRGSGLLSVAHTDGTGVYSVIFDRSITTCIFTATAFSLGDTAVRITSSGSGGQVTLVVFRTTDGAFIDQGFFINVFCPQ